MFGRRARHIFHIILDAFSVYVEQALNPELKEKLVIVGRHPERGRVVPRHAWMTMMVEPFFFIPLPEQNRHTRTNASVP